MAESGNNKGWIYGSILVAVAVTTFLLTDKKDVDLSAEENAPSTATLAAVNENNGLEIPLQGLDVPYTSFMVDAKKGGNFDFQSGSSIHIPADAFVDSAGNAVEGAVEIKFREFHDAVDFFVSGIDMTYDSADITYQFESAGMMEILGFQGGKKVAIKEGKSINVELASEQEETDYNLYKLNPFKNDWSCLGKDKVVKKPSPLVSEPYRAPNTITVEDSPIFITVQKKVAEVEDTIASEIAALPKVMRKPIKPAKVNDDKFTFDLEVDPKEFPEIALYKGMLFEVGDENKKFSSKMYDIIWDEAIIKEGNKKGTNYKLTLTKQSKEFNLIVYPVFEEKDYEVAKKKFQDKFVSYSAALEKRVADEKKIEEAYQEQLAVLKKEQVALQLKWKKQQENRFASMATEEKVRRMFAVNSFGIFNCDRPSSYPKGAIATLDLVNEKSNKVDCYNVYLVDKEKNALFTYSKNPVVEFSYNPTSSNLLWTVDNGVLYWVKPDGFSAIASSGTSQLTMNKVDQQFKNVEELKAYLNF